MVIYSLKDEEGLNGDYLRYDHKELYYCTKKSKDCSGKWKSVKMNYFSFTFGSYSYIYIYNTNIQIYMFEH